MSVFAERLKELRLANKMTQGQMSEFMGCSLRNYQDYEYGKVYPHVPAIVKLAKEFHVSLDYLFGLTD